MLLGKICDFEQKFWTSIFGRNINFNESWSLNNYRRISSDVYLYLSLQRALIYLSFFIMVCSLVYSITINIALDPNLNITQLEWSQQMLINLLYGNQDLAVQSWQWSQVSFCFIITAATIITILLLRNKAMSIFQKMHPYVDDINDDWLRSHTLFVKGLLKSDSKGELLESILNEKLEKFGGRVLNLKIPEHDYANVKRNSLSLQSTITDKALII